MTGTQKYLCQCTAWVTFTSDLTLARGLYDNFELFHNTMNKSSFLSNLQGREQNIDDVA
jgi:hypothetical protein